MQLKYNYLKFNYYDIFNMSKKQGQQEFPFGNSRDPGNRTPQNSRREFPGISRNSELMFLIS